MRIILSSLLTVFLSLSALGSAQVAKPRFVLTISAEAPAAKTGPASYSVKAGSEVFITVHLTNTSQRNLALGYDADSRTGVVFGHQYEIHDNSGNAARKQTINHPELGSTGHGWPARILKPGESMDINGDQIGRLYDLSRPGQYTIQLSRPVSDNSKDGFVKSNAITLTVTP